MLIFEAESAEAEKAITIGVFETCGCWNYKTSLLFSSLVARWTCPYLYYLTAVTATVGQCERCCNGMVSGAGSFLIFTQWHLSTILVIRA